MSKVITYSTPDGGVAVVYPATDSLTLEEIADKDLPAGVSRAFVEASELPDRYFRNAWEYDGPKGAKINIEKAKEVQRNHWRKLREPKLAELDIEVMKAVEGGNTAKRKEVADRKQALRDVTDQPLPDDPAAIKATIPEILL